MISPRCGQSGQGSLSSLRRGVACGLQVQKLFVDGCGFALTSLVDAGFSQLKGRLRRHHQPPLGHAVVA
jgi:hypothetical protein